MRRACSPVSASPIGCGRTSSRRRRSASSAARPGRDIVRVPLGAKAEQRYGAPYWVIHRADLQAVLAAAIEESPDVTLRLGTRVEDFALHQHGVTVQARTAARRARRAGHRADRRRRVVVGAARAPRRPAARRASRSAPPGARSCRPRSLTPEFRAARHRPVARARRASGALSGQGRHDGQHRGDRARRLA